jgi:large subunit ribosomal protein L23
MSNVPVYQILKSPVLTEKAFALTQEGKYTFIVGSSFSKFELAEAFESLFPNTSVTSVRTIRIPAKQKRAGRKPVFRKAYSKAIFSTEGEPIELIPGV